MDELARLRERVRELEQQNLTLLRENAQLRTTGAVPRATLTRPSAPAERRVGMLAASVVGAPVAVEAAVVEDDIAFLPFLEGSEYGLDIVGTELYAKAKTLMPQGCGLISKMPETFLPDRWPSYYDRAEGCFVWDLSGNKYMDMCNAPGPYALGAADPDVNAAVLHAVQSGSFSTLNPPCVARPTPIFAASCRRRHHPIDVSPHSNHVTHPQGGGGAGRGPDRPPPLVQGQVHTQR